MITPPGSITSQEKMAGALAAILFFVPLLMNVKTPFVISYMKQGFLINVISVIFMILGSMFWLLGGIIGTLNMICFFVSLFLAFQAYSGKEHTIAVLTENSEKLIKILGISSIFTPGK